MLSPSPSLTVCHALTCVYGYEVIYIHATAQTGLTQIQFLSGLLCEWTNNNSLLHSSTLWQNVSLHWNISAMKLDFMLLQISRWPTQRECLCPLSFLCVSVCLSLTVSAVTQSSFDADAKFTKIYSGKKFNDFSCWIFSSERNYLNFIFQWVKVMSHGAVGFFRVVKRFNECLSAGRNDCTDKDRSFMDLYFIKTIFQEQTHDCQTKPLITIWPVVEAEKSWYKTLEAQTSCFFFVCVFLALLMLILSFCFNLRIINFLTSNNKQLPSAYHSVNVTYKSNLIRKQSNGENKQWAWNWIRLSVFISPECNNI